MLQSRPPIFRTYIGRWRWCLALRGSCYRSGIAGPAAAQKSSGELLRHLAVEAPAAASWQARSQPPRGKVEMPWDGRLFSTTLAD